MEAKGRELAVFRTAALERLGMDVALRLVATCYTPAVHHEQRIVRAASSIPRTHATRQPAPDVPGRAAWF